MTLVETLRRGGLARIALARRQRAEDAPVRAAAPPPAGAAPEDAPRLRDWIGILAMGTGLFLAIMDVQIVTSSLTQIPGWAVGQHRRNRLGANGVSDRRCRHGSDVRIHVSPVVHPRAVRHRRAGFTGASVLCATATSLDEMIVYRAMQGFCGGALTPTVWPVVYTKSTAGNWRASSRCSR